MPEICKKLAVANPRLTCFQKHLLMIFQSLR